MASIATGSEHQRRSVNHEPPLIPMIDLLLCCIMFLLVTAVWNRLASVDANLEAPASRGAIDGPPPPRAMIVHVDHDGFLVSGEIGDQLRIARTTTRSLDAAALHEHLQTRRQLAPSARRVVVAADDGIAYAEVVQTIDLLSGAGYEELTVAGPQ